MTDMPGIDGPDGSAEDAPFNAEFKGYRRITFDNGRHEDCYVIEIDWPQGGPGDRFEAIWVKRSEAVARRIAAALSPSGPDPTSAEYALKIIAAPPITDAPDAIGVSARNIARAALTLRAKYDEAQATLVDIVAGKRIAELEEEIRHLKAEREYHRESRR